MQSCRSSRAVVVPGYYYVVASEYLCSPTRCTFTVLQLWLATSLSCDGHTGKARRWQMVSERHFKVQTPSQSQGKSRTDRPLGTRASSPRSPWAPRGPTPHLLQRHLTGNKSLKETHILYNGLMQEIFRTDHWIDNLLIATLKVEA